MALVAITALTIDWSSKALFDEFKIFRNHCNRIFARFMCNATQQEKINYLLLWASCQIKTVVTNNHQVDTENDTVETYYKLFEANIIPISKFWVAHHQFYQLKQSSTEAIDEYVLHLRDYIRECRFWDQVHNEILLDCIIFRNFHEALIHKCLSKGMSSPSTKPARWSIVMRQWMPAIRN